ncbi:apolipoprotein d-like [Plakobranchus ocellatus]|uniref:Apolipoprotein D n=1 Tax=Plakobranchus ocellatus TaxID=259542 RepID=A0AAV4C0B2_9GAST|nr:apolipoprotein d-like [Plakobranchus ocellatus]
MDSVLLAKFVTLTLVLLAGSADGQVVLKFGKCPKVVGQPTLDKDKYFGVWYEYERFPAIFEAGLDCTSATYSPAEDAIKVTNNGTLRTDLLGKKVVLRNSTSNGRAVVINPDKPAELSVAFGGAPQSKRANYKIMATDYTTYSVIFSCTQLEEVNLQFAWILTRARGVAPPNLKRLKSKLAAAGVDVTEFFVVDQKDCPAKGPTTADIVMDEV